jgi:hypothetical protein
MLLTHSKEVEKDYKDESFYEKIPIFESWKNYILEEVTPDSRRKIPINRIDDVDSLVDSLGNNKNLIFRGHENPSWKLCPTLHRKYIGDFPTVDELTKYLKQFQEALIIEAGNSNDSKLHVNAQYQLTKEELKELDKQSLWELGQHYGLSTEYLDWTLDINKALFFAFEPEQWHEPFPYRVLYVLNKKMPDEILNLINIMPPSNANNLRMQKQEGIFTKTTIPKEFEEIISNNLKISDKYFRKIYVSCNQRKAFINKLQTQGINYQELFTGLDGAVRSCNSLIYSRAYFNGTIKISQRVINPPDKD